MKTGIVSDRRSLLLLWCVAVQTLTSCEKKEFISIAGKTMGTYYSVQYNAAEDLRDEIDSILAGFISAASTYDPGSELDEFNKNGIVYFRTSHLPRMLTLARRFHSETRGAFEPTLMPLIQAYRSARNQNASVSNRLRDSLLSLVSFQYVDFDATKMSALKPGVQVDLSAMGEGYAIDLIAGFLESRQVEDYKVEIGGEMKCKGKNPKDEWWLIGIENPRAETRGGKMLVTTTLRNEAISTSGNYRKIYTDAHGKKHSHLLDPRTGKSVDNTLLSVTIKARTAVTADVLATASMVLGLDEAIALIRHTGVEGFITFEEKGRLKTWHTRGF